MTSGSLNSAESIALFLMSLSGVGTWWASNFRLGKRKLMGFVTLGILSSAWLISSVF